MQRKVTFGILTIFVCLFVVTFDRWGRIAFLRFVLSSFAPTEFPKIIKESGTENDFPADFLIGTSSSAYQIEGAWDEQGKTPSIWDDFVHFHPHVVDDNSTGDVSADSYHNWKQDMLALKQVGVGKHFASLLINDAICCFYKVSALSLQCFMDENLAKWVSNQSQWH